MLSVPVGTLIGLGVGVLLSVAALIAGANWAALSFFGFGSVVGLAGAAVAAAGGTVATLIVRHLRLTVFGRSFVALAAGIAVFLATSLFGVIVPGFRTRAGRPHR